MKKKNLIIIGVSVVVGFILLAAFTLKSSMKTESLSVLGKCGLCEKRIESSANEIEGVEKADWDVDSKQLTVSFDPEKTSLEEISKEIADAGHDTELDKATDAAFNNLPGCCKYER